MIDKNRFLNSTTWKNRGKGERKTWAIYIAVVCPINKICAVLERIPQAHGGLVTEGWRTTRPHSTRQFSVFSHY